MKSVRFPVFVVALFCFSVAGCDSKSPGRIPECKPQEVASRVRKGEWSVGQLEIRARWAREGPIPDSIYRIVFRGTEGYALFMQGGNLVPSGGVRKMHTSEQEVLQLLDAMVASAGEAEAGDLHSRDNPPDEGTLFLGMSLDVSEEGRQGFVVGLLCSWGGVVVEPLSPTATRYKEMAERLALSGRLLEPEEEVAFLSEPDTITLFNETLAWRMMQIRSDASTQVLKKWAKQRRFGRPTGIPGDVTDAIVRELAARKNATSP